MKLTSAILSAVLAAFVATSVAVTLPAQVKQRPLPRLVKKDGRFALFVDDAPYLILGAEDLMLGVESTWPRRSKVWLAMDYMNVNTVEIAVYWNQFEPQPGQYNYAVIDRLLTEARQHKVRLVPLWFGTIKNGSQHYMPDWMKLDPVRYAHVVAKDGNAVDSPSPYCAASLEADKSAFVALMRHLKEADPQRTVIMVQVENETGTWGSVRDYSPAAQKFFEAPVPPEVLSAMQVKTASPSPNWQQAFGPDADEYFHAWSVARYVGQVAAAGKAVYPLPMFANAALRDPFHPGPPGRPGARGSYESGGPTDNVIPIWKAAAPAIDFLAPDDYQNDPASYLKVLELYHRDDNPLYLPETGCSGCERFFFSALGLQTIGVSPAGNTTQAYILGPQAGTQAGSSNEWQGSRLAEGFLTAWAMNFRLIGPMQREIARLNFDGKLQAVAEMQGKATETLPFGSWDAVVSFGAARENRAAGNPKPTGRALVAQLKDNQFLVTGYFCRVDFRPADPEHRPVVVGTEQNPSALIDGKWQHRQFLRIEQGNYENGVFKLIRTWNGGETDWGLNFGEEPVVMRVSLATY
jgi:hypothetical protein